MSMQSLDGPDGSVKTHPTRRTVGDLFMFTNRGPDDLKKSFFAGGDSSSGSDEKEAIRSLKHRPHLS